MEAYVGTDDRASHARFGQTARNATMFGPPGRAYVYLVYGMYHCLNVVTQPETMPSALLVRAVEPVAGVESMREARLTWATSRKRDADDSRAASAARRLRGLDAGSLASGPGLVCAAFSVTRHDDGADLCDPSSGLRLEKGTGEAPLVAAAVRIGIGYAAEPWLSKPWRFYDPGSPAVSRPLPSPKVGQP